MGLVLIISLVFTLGWGTRGEAPLVLVLGLRK